MQDDLSAAIQEAARIVRESTYVISLIGAGISAESGLPLYRGPEGIWTRLGREPSNDAYRQFLEDPANWWQRRREGGGGGGMGGGSWDDARPNPAHYALADLERMGVMKHVITQNVDNLHVVAGTQSLSEFHGNRTKVRCIGCNARWPRAEFEFPAQGFPACPHCGGLVKSDSVMRGEPIPPNTIKRSFAEAEQADCCIIIGTSAVIFPVAEIPMVVRRNGGRLIEVNPMETRLSEYCDVVLRGPAGEVMPAIVGALR
jgi:NAD-dependent deacetylase